MITILTVFVGLAMLGVVGVLFAGMLGLVRGGGSPERSNKLMQWRIVLQAVAIALFVLLMTLMKSR